MIACIVPAAGFSTRFPWNKMLYTLDKPLVVQTLENISASTYVSRVILVTGHESSRVSRVVEEHASSRLKERLRVVYNPDYATGMSSSVRKGLESIRDEARSLKGIMVNPGDAAWIHPGVYDYVALRFLESGKKIAVASYRGRRGHPIIFSSDLYAELTAIDEETQGLKAVVRRHLDDTLLVETGYPGVLLDLDTVLDLNRVKEYSWR